MAEIETCAPSSFPINYHVKPLKVSNVKHDAKQIVRAETIKSINFISYQIYADFDIPSVVVAFGYF